MIKKIKRFTAMLLALFLLWLTAAPMPAAQAATTLTEKQFATKIAALQEEYPHGKYWNAYNGLDDEGIALAGDNICSGVSNYDGYTCRYHGTCAYGGGCTCECGYYHGWQCFGFANLMCYKVFGSYATNGYDSSGVNTADGWQYYTSVSEYFAGDNVRVNNAHSIFLLKVTEDTVYYADCNASGPCKINWTREMSLSSLFSKTTYVVRMKGNTLKGIGSAANTLTMGFDLNGGTIPEAQTYKVTTDGAGLWLRSSYSTSASALTLIPDATTLTITDTVDSGLYTWGKTTYGGYDGWCAISAGLTERTGYFLDESDTLCTYPNGTAFTAQWAYGSGNNNGLFGAEDLSMTREGYTFAGWALSPDGSGTVFAAHDAGLKAEDICPEVQNGDQAVTLYAVWLKDGDPLTGQGFSLSFEDEILVNFYFSAEDVEAQELGMLVFYNEPAAVDINTANDVYPNAEYNPSTGNYMSQTLGIAAKEMGDTRYYAAYAKLADGSYLYSQLYSYSPKAYALSRLEKSTDANMKALCAAMLNYGAQAQLYFGYKTHDLMNASLTAEQKALVADYSAGLFRGAVSADPAKVGSFAKTATGFSGRSATVSFEGAFAINYYFTPDSAVDTGVTFYYWTPADYAKASTLTTSNASGKMTMVKNTDGSYWAEVTGIAAKQLDDTYYVAAFYTNNSEVRCTGVIAYSLSKYCVNNAKAGNPMEALAAATAVYGYHAKAYFSAT